VIPSGPPRHLSMIRGFHLADFLTLGNAACGMLAIFAVLDSMTTSERRGLLLAAALPPVALVLDFMDGRVARWRQRHSAMGRELDSLADVISFGVAPASIAYGAGLDGVWDVLVLLYFVACGVSRLARYNISADELAAETGKVKYFEGTPIPTSVVLVGVVALAAWRGALGDALPLGVVQLGPGRLHPLVVLWAISGSLMISKTLRIPKP
jgi:CDP-diacylglycerol---serine O-phosphatidyltransferase